METNYKTELTTIYHGNANKVLPWLDAGSAQTCVTSPPYWGLRDYGHDEQLGLEETYEEYVANLVKIFREVKRVLKDDGTLWLNLGDSYVNNSKPGGGDPTIGKRNIGASEYSPAVVSGLPSKNLVGIPWRVAFALQADGWYLRNDIIWNKPSCMPSSATDRCTVCHEYIFLLSKKPKYYYDHEAILEPAKYDGRKDTKYKGGDKDMACSAHERWPRKIRGLKTKDDGGLRPGNNQQNHGSDIKDGVPARNKRTVWTVNPKPYKGAHFACFPPDLITPCILAGAPKGGVVLDPFFGSGTTAEVAEKHGRKCIGIELNPEYGALQKERIQQPYLI